MGYTLLILREDTDLPQAYRGYMYRQFTGTPHAIATSSPRGGGQ
jgi:hypothetical protein